MGVNWYSILDQYPGKFTADLSMIYTQSPEDGREMYGRIALDPDDETIMHVSWDSELRPNDYNITAIIDPTTYNPGTPTGTVRYLILEDINTNPGAELPGYDGPDAWKSLDGRDTVIPANAIIEWSGTEWVDLISFWSVSTAPFDSSTVYSTGDIVRYEDRAFKAIANISKLENSVAPGENSKFQEIALYFTNLKTGVQYRWSGDEWLKSFEGEYVSGYWRFDLNG
jgi:hypothetical protein